MKKRIALISLRLALGVLVCVQRLEAIEQVFTKKIQDENEIKPYILQGSSQNVKILATKLRPFTINVYNDGSAHAKINLGLATKFSQQGFVEFFFYKDEAREHRLDASTSYKKDFILYQEAGDDYFECNFTLGADQGKQVKNFAMKIHGEIHHKNRVVKNTLNGVFNNPIRTTVGTLACLGLVGVLIMKGRSTKDAEEDAPKGSSSRQKEALRPARAQASIASHA